MIWILLSGIFFVGIHLVIAGTRLRDRLVALVGERAYLASFSLLSAAGITSLCMAYAAAPPQAPWWGAAALRPAAWVGTFVAFQLVLIGLTTPSPTASGREKLLGAKHPATGILRITRHPFLWGVALWALCHLLVNPEPASFLFFGALLLLSLLGPRSIDAKRARRYGNDWARFAAVTSNLPFAAIASGRNRLALSELGIGRVALAAALWAALLLGLHAWLFGVSAR